MRLNMILKGTVVAALALAASTAVLAQNASEEVGNSPVGSFIAPDIGAPVWTRGMIGTVLFDNGPLVNSPGTGAGGADESVLQVALTMSTIGFGHQIANDNRIADNFTIPAGESWAIDEIVFFAYQTGSTTTSTIDDLRVRIWDGIPDEPGSTIVFGDLTTNVLAATAFSGIYRVTDTTSGATNRPIMANQATINTVLTEGTYYLDWMSGGTLGSGPWAPPITINGQTTTGDGLQSLAGAAYGPAIDTGSSTVQGFPFIIMGTVQGGPIPETQPVPALGTIGLIALVLMLGLFAATVLRRRA